MRNIALAIVVLAVTIPAMGDVTITITSEANQVTIGYDCNDGEVVRAFALNIDVNTPSFIVGSAESVVDPNKADYYIYPGSVSFTVVDGNTVIDQFGTPIAEQDANGGVLEMASLYSVNDPDPNRHDPPESSGELAKFWLDVHDSNYCDTVTLSVNSKRGGVVLEDPNETFTLNLPDPSDVCPCLLVVGQYCGGVQIDATMMSNWVTAGRPQSWCHPAHYAGDISRDCKVTAIDVIGGGPDATDSWYSKCFGKVCGDALYSPEGDNNNDCKITAIDIIGGSAAVCLPPDCGIANNFGLVITGQPPECP